MTAFNKFVKDFQDEHGRTPTNVDLQTLISPYRVRELKEDDFDGRSTNGGHNKK